MNKSNLFITNVFLFLFFTVTVPNAGAPTLEKCVVRQIQREELFSGIARSYEESNEIERYVLYLAAVSLCESLQCEKETFRAQINKIQEAATVPPLNASIFSTIRNFFGRKK